MCTDIGARMLGKKYMICYEAQLMALHIDHTVISFDIQHMSGRMYHHAEMLSKLPSTTEKYRTLTILLIGMNMEITQLMQNGYITLYDSY